MVSCNQFSRKKPDQLFAWILSLACCSNLCSRKIKSFTLCPVCDGKFIAMLSRKMDHIAFVAVCLVQSLSGAWLLYQVFSEDGSLLWASRERPRCFDQQLRFVSRVCCPNRGHFNMPVHSFPSGRSNSLLTFGHSSSVSKNISLSR